MDDGYSGTNYNRPDFQRMLNLVEDGQVGIVIVKDLSRLGRDYLQTGYYTEVVFPEHNVRFIAINDNVDSAAGDNEFAPFKNIINENLSLRRAEQKQHRRTALGIKTGDSSSNVWDESPVFMQLYISSIRAHLPFVLNCCLGFHASFGTCPSNKNPATL